MGDTRKLQKLTWDFECWTAMGVSGGHFVSKLNH